MIEKLDEFAEQLQASRAHVCDLVLSVAMNEEAERFCDAVAERLNDAREKLRERWQ
ncbi:hypothetical protein [Aeoliella mucimassa]|uniref:hypothetical protein n=1 Tax=Aeoliella mucimassa TaxID=2527972 RepID=UPI0018D4D5F5|nr:hypothetical protein [Aeoliella mucimassa]